MAVASFRVLERVCLKVGTVIEGEVRCYVTADKVEVADIRLADGRGVLEGVPCKFFWFLDKQEG
jgi:hypothetical protein